MATFNLGAFVKRTIMKMIDAGREDWRVMQYAITYYERDILTDADMLEIQAAIDARDSEPEPEPEPVEPENVENEQEGA